MIHTLYKSSDTSLYATTTMTADADLQFELEAGAKYLIRGQAFMRGSTPGDLKHGFYAGGATLTYGGGTSLVWSQSYADSTLETINNGGGPWTKDMIQTSGSSKYVPMVTGAYKLPIKYCLMLDVGATGGTFAFTFAQYVSDPSNPVTLMEGSIMLWERLT